MKKYTRQDQRLLASCAADCAQRVLPLFEKVNRADKRPRHSVKKCREWIRTGVFKMAEIRGASLAAHAAARQAKGNDAAVYAARAAGQAVATAHVPQHAFGAAYYALKSIAAAHPANGGDRVVSERLWQARRLPIHLRQELLRRVRVRKDGDRLTITIRKGRGY